MTSGSHAEIQWISESIGRVFPREWDAFNAASGRRPGQRLLDAYVERLTDPDPQVRTAAALAWCTWEDTHVSLDPTFKPWLAQQDPQFRELFALHVAHSWAHDAFLGERGILDQIATIAHLPAVLIHGRLDVSGRSSPPGNCTNGGPQVDSSSLSTKATATRTSAPPSIPVPTPTCWPVDLPADS